MAVELDPNSGLWAPYSVKETGTGTSSEVEVTRTPNNSLDKNAFLNLLVTQMKYQDPLNPVDDKQFLAQMAQFTSLEQMQNMNATTSKSQAYSMIGKNVYSEIYNSETYDIEVVEGYVSAVTMKNGNPYLIVLNKEGKEKEVPIEDVKEVWDQYPVTSQMQSMYNSLATSQNMALIGKFVQAITSDEDGNYQFVEGKVDYVKFSNGQTLLVVGNKEIWGAEVISVSDDAKEMMLLGNTISVNKKNEVSKEYEEYIKGGVISDVKLDKENAYLIVNGKEIKIDAVNYVTEALRYVGNEITSGTVKGTVSEVVIQDAKTYLNVLGSDGEHRLVEFTKVRGK